MNPADNNEFLTMLARCKTSNELAFITVLYYTGARVSEIIALEAKDVYVSGVKVYFKIRRLKGSTATRDISFFTNQLGFDTVLNEVMLAEKEQRRVFPFSRTTAWRISKRTTGVYPHFFRYNRFTYVVDKYGLTALRAFGGITLDTSNRYMLEKELGEMVIE